jgi:hypothetical protein
LGIARKAEQAVQVHSTIATIAVNRQVIHG